MMSAPVGNSIGNSSSHLNSATSSSTLSGMRGHVNVINVTMARPTVAAPPAPPSSSDDLNPPPRLITHIENGPVQHRNLQAGTPAPTGRVSYVRRGNFYGALYDADHLATFAVDGKKSPMRAEDAIRKLRQVNKTQGVWSMACQLMVDSKFVVVFDKETGQEVETFPLELVNDSTSVISDEPEDVAFNNVIMFTVLEDPRRGKSSPPTEVHMFQCAADVNSADIVDEIYKMKETRLATMANEPSASMSQSKLRAYTIAQPDSYRSIGSYPPASHPNPDPAGFRRLIISTQQQQQQHPKPSSLPRHRVSIPSSPSKPTYPSQSNLAAAPKAVDFVLPSGGAQKGSQLNSAGQLIASRLDLEMQVLNHCFDDIERFVSRLQANVETLRELEKRHQKYRHKSTKSKKSKLLCDELQAARAQLPQPQSFVDIFQKLKLSFNLLAQLKAHIHKPNAPELVNFLFNPLGLILSAIDKEIAWLLDTTAAIETSGQIATSASLKGLVKTVWLPMLSREAKELMFNCLNSRDQELWFELGDAWMVSREDAKMQPHLYATNIDLNQQYSPVFYDGWTPNLSALLGPSEPYSVSYPSYAPTPNGFSRLTHSAAAQVHQNGLKHVERHVVDSNSSSAGMTVAPPPAPPLPTTANYGNKRINFVDESTLSTNSNRPTSGRAVTGGGVRGAPNQNDSNASTALNYSTKGPILNINIRNYDEMKRWAIDLAYRGAKVYEVVHDRQANNEKELTIKAGELLEVLDDKRNWWKLRNFYGNIGHAPVTILRPFDASMASM